MTILTQRMREELVRRNYAETTISTYLRSVEQFREYARKRLDHLGPDDMRRYQAYLLENKKLAVGTVVLHISALRFLYVKVLGRREMKQELPYPKHRKRLPTILSPEEVARLIDSARTLSHRAMLMTLYSAGLRRAELCRLKVADIDSQRMMLRVERGKGGVDREVPLSQKLLETLREHYRWIRPKRICSPARSTTGASTHPSHRRSSGWRFVKRPNAPGSRSASHLTRCGIVTRRTCSNPALISEPSNCSWGTWISRRQRSTCTFPGSTCRRRRIRWINSRFPLRRALNVRADGTSPHEPAHPRGGRSDPCAGRALCGAVSIVAQPPATQRAAGDRSLSNRGFGGPH